MPVAKPIPVERVKQLLDYDSETGVFRWRETRCGKAKIGQVAGRIAKGGYRQIQIDGLLYMAHRLAFAYVHGDLPPDMEVDHIDGQYDHNWIGNLREATCQQNKHNRTRLDRRNTTGANGVSFEKPRGKYRAQITIDKVIKNLGYFDTLEAAQAARHAAERIHYPYAQINRIETQAPA